MFISGGVDSSVAFALLNKALGKEKILGLYINTVS
jgi:GMP synthase (glutamine-hydrolysing)